MEPSNYRVSTITCNASVSTQVDLQVFFENVQIHPDRFVWSEYGSKTKGEPIKKRREGAEPKKSFDNQVTVLLRMRDKYYPNVKLFRNGNIQMTGIRTYEDGNYVVEQIVEEVRRIAGIAPVVAKKEDVKGTDFKIRMINCDFGFPFKIRRRNLHQLLISDKYDNSCSFEPLTYPGVKLQYFWNEQKNNKGVCTCTNPCYGKGTGLGDGECKKVTVSVFDSGRILITGANSFEQVNEAYKYICDVVKENAKELMKVLPH